MGTKFLAGPVEIGQGAATSNGFRLDVTSVLLLRVEQVARSCGKSPIRGNIQGQIGQGLEQAGLLQVVLARCRVVGVNDL